MISDAHVYCIPSDLAQLPLDVLKEKEPSVYRDVYTHPEANEAFKKSEINNILGEMKRASVMRSLLVSFPWIQPEHCTLNNDYNLKQSQKYENIFSICSVNPFKSGAHREVLRCKSEGAVGIKINPEWQLGSLNSKEVIELAHLCAREKLFIMTHIDHPFKKSNSSPAELWALLENCPDTSFIAAHMGGMIGTYSLLPKFKELFKNVYFDTAVSLTLEMVKIYIDLGLEDKIILGSDYPFNHSHEIKQVVDDLNLILKDNSDIKSKIMNKNLDSLLGLKE